MSKLPRILSGRLQRSTKLVSAYSIILLAERDVEGRALDSPDDTTLQKNLICVRILGCLLEYAPGDKARSLVASEILGSYGDMEGLLAIGRWYLDHFERLLRYSKQRNWAGYGPSTEPVLGVPLTHDDAESLVKRRDNFHCLLTGCPDRRACIDGDDAFREQVLKENYDGIPSTTYGCHIINLVTDSRVRGGDYSMSTWAILQRLGLQSVLEELSGHGVHRLENMITAILDAQLLFNELRIWFVAVPNSPNVYELHHNLERWDFHAKVQAGKIELKTPDPVNCPLPSPRYLEIHAACARVAHFSGALRYIYKRLWNADCVEMMMPPVLDADGSSESAGLLARLLANKASRFGIAVEGKGHGFTFPKQLEDEAFRAFRFKGLIKRPFSKTPPIALPVGRKVYLSSGSGAKAGNSPKQAESYPDWASAYAAILDIERGIEERQIGDSKSLIFCRILGYLLECAPGGEARSIVASEILDCNGDVDRILAIGAWYFEHLEHLFKYIQRKEDSIKGFSQCSAEMDEDLSSPDEFFASHAAAEDQVKIRDDDHCLLTGSPDLYRWVKDPDFQERTKYWTPPFYNTRGCHILNHVTESSGDDYNGPSAIWDVITRLGCQSTLEELQGSQVHRLENMMTLSSVAYTLFSNLMVWLVRVPGEPNTYLVENAYRGLEFSGIRLREKVVFASPDLELKYPVPSP
ncbi:hypothetical protein D9611_010051 [Ephemerocybe angulata]|uniref:HNH nuclease domain-containing protein n=1 Tax=Ephemerocybe angulata TaxID=980116 RepID=A0A8H5FFT7_9AGAR|nr:hypothetical protein D9611_010051 [Tulosesus angulatus]